MNLEENLQDLLNQNLYQLTLSGARKPEQVQKIKIRPVLLREELLFQKTSYAGTKVFHENLTKEAAIADITRALQEDFKQLALENAGARLTALASKKGKITVKRTELLREGREKEDMPAGQAPERGASLRNISELAHNRKKKYLLPEGTAVPFLVDLGVQTRDGKIVHARYDKFRQINRFLELIEDILPQLPTGRTLRVIDFGCGKSYLTFAAYYYLHEIKGYDLRVTGLDLKADVISACNALRDKYGYTGLNFEIGNIKDYDNTGEVDIVMTLHACDTATDFALEKAVRWGAGVIMSVPCCQHEINRQISCEELEAVLKYGIIKERMSALITDALRAGKLEEYGYETQILEFIDIEHTPKNLMIRAVKKAGSAEERARRKEELEKVSDFLGVHPTLQKLL